MIGGMDELRIPPEAGLLRDAYNRMTPKPSVRELAGVVALSEGRVRQIFSGYQSLGRGQKATVIAPTDTLVRLAVAVGVTPTQLAEAGRADAAEAMGVFVRTAAQVSSSIDAVERLQEWLAAGDISGDPPGQSLWLFSDSQLLDEVRRRLDDGARWRAERMASQGEGGSDAGQAEDQKIGDGPDAGSSDRSPRVAAETIEAPATQSVESE